MTGVFDGIAGTLSGVFGSMVAFRPATGDARDVQSIFRLSPIEITGADGQILRIDAPTWRVSRDLVPEAARGDRIDVPGRGLYRLMVSHDSGSPAADAFVIWELHKETP
ncbi:hypothetical protein KY389_11490 [Paracoccus bogoriensis]|uniref:head-tail joining protein n=1 Tax=Paracoccus bogoriensis TaxID=242065 RepID=UPI001CA5AE86|nr:hypothetical protein [Paracoccus bogoriensis]MBW7057308.1 hypothetical protein [Paracoccus bogoriensis]